MDAPQSALTKKIRCPICSEIFVAALPKAEVIEDEHVEPSRPTSPPKRTKPEKPSKPDEPTASGDLPIVLSAGSEPAPSGESEEVDPSDPLSQLTAAGLKPGRRRKAAPQTGKAAARGKKAGTARKALESFATAPPPKVHWPGGKDKPEIERGVTSTRPPSAPTRYRPASKDVWFVLAGDYEYGPYAPQAILAAIRSGKIPGGIQLRHALSDSVITAARILELLPKQLRPAAPQPPRKPAKGKKPAPKSSADRAASSALDSMDKRPSKGKPRGKGKRKQSRGG